MAEYERGRNRYESDRIKKLKEIELAKGQQFVPKSGAVPASAQFTTQSRPAPIVQNTQQGSNLRTAAASAGVSQQQNNIVINTEETTAGGIGIYKNVPFTDDTGKPYTKIFDSVREGRFRDILFVNGNTTQSLAFNLLLSRVDITKITSSEPNKVILGSKDTVFLGVNIILAQAGVSPANPKQLSFSELVGTTQKIIAGTQPFYLYIHKIANQGQLDVTVLK